MAGASAEAISGPEKAGAITAGPAMATKHRLVDSDANLGSDGKAVAVTQQPIRIPMSKSILCNKL